MNIRAGTVEEQQSTAAETEYLIEEAAVKALFSNGIVC
jgi:hypothetical protein